MNQYDNTWIKTEVGSAALLLLCTLIALVWANSPEADVYEDLWATHVRIGFGGLVIDENLRHWVNDGLMALFFYVVGLEIRYELVFGELNQRRKAALPVIAAIAGMVVPALLYTAVAGGGAGARGWGIVMATDIAFVLGLVSLVGDRCPPGVRLFLLTLAIVDDIGAVAVIALFYSTGIDPLPLAGAVVVLGAVAAARRLPRWTGPAYALAGLLLWALAYASGVHPTIAAVALGLVTGVHAAQPGRRSPNERFQALVHPWSSRVVVPLFALANAGVALGGSSLRDALTSEVALAVVFGLVVGKAAGISLASLAALRLGVGELPAGMRVRHLVGAAAAAGIGFTVSLFVTELAFADELLRDQAKLGVLIASVIAAALSLALLRSGPRIGSGS